MKAIVCEMCGSQNLVKEDGMYVCQNCNTKYSPDDAKKLMVEIDNSEKIKNYYTLARRAKESDNAEDAVKYYDLIRQENPNDWEANYFAGYFQALQCKIGEIGITAQTFSGCVHSSLCLIKEHIQDDNERLTAVQTVVTYSQQISDMFSNTYNKHYDNNEFKSKEEKSAVAGQLGQLKNVLRSDLITLFKNDSAVFPPVVIPILKAYISKWKYFYGEKETCLNYESLIKKYEPEYNSGIENLTYTKPTNKSGGCYVATAIYGTYNCPEVWTLRRYRDDTLAQSWYGRAFIHTYYAVSPTLVRWFGNTNWFKNMWKPKLDRMVARLNGEGVENTPYEDKNW